MKKLPQSFTWPTKIGLASAVLSLALSQSSIHGQSADALINKLVDKGILTMEEAKTLRESSPESEQGNKTGGQRGQQDNDVNFFWKNGLNFKSADGKTFQGKLGGRVLMDAASHSLDDDAEAALGDAPAGFEFRQVRIRTEGKLNTGIETKYKVQLDWAGGGVAFKDVYLEWADIPLIGKIRAGHYKEPLGLESMNSRRFLMFMERSSISEAFWSERNAGVSIGDSILNDRMTWTTAAFVNADDGSGDSAVDSNGSLVARITGVAYENSEKKQLVHLGASGSAANTKDDSIRLRSRPESHLAPRFVDTGAIAADAAYTAALEAAFVWGPFSLQGEYMHKVVDSIGMSDLDFSGYTVTAGYYLTGETRNYKKSSGAFERVIPKNNFSLTGEGLGAIQIALRYSSLDLNDSVVTGGEMDTITTGLNWHLNPNTRAMLNYIYADVESGVGTDFAAHTVQGRLQIDF
ncbi:porin [Verrucomicrobia bacterium]|jgi:phosphate-selective porin OprO and OprP|nr:porin [bacterium]MDA7680438.1 porin [bacterium]MDB4798415.1 porin [Verrucomicrobiota bacterium]